MCAELSHRGWKTEPVTEGKNELHVARKNGKKLILKIRCLAKVAPVPFPQGLDTLDRIDYLVICNNLRGLPNIIPMEPSAVRDVAHKDKKNDAAYWLQDPDYNRHGLNFGRVFGQAELGLYHGRA